MQEIIMNSTLPSILQSIKPQYCELIANGKKTIEVRKTRPKIDPPFKVYMYCTKDKNKIFWYNSLYRYIDDRSHNPFDKPLNGKVIGEYICDSIIPISITYSDPNCRVATREFPFTCLTDKQLIDYLGNGKQGGGYHISDLMIYDKPKELSDFYVIDNDAVNKCTYRERCGQPEYKTANRGWIKGSWICSRDKGFDFEWCNKCKTKPLTRPPQSWCYVEELR